MDKNINTYVEILRDEIINSTCEIINIPSVFSDADALLDYIEKEASAPIDLRHLKNI